jgi:phosphatidylethanolamine-binding protein (PEBP) family uncharacterized protein
MPLVLTSAAFTHQGSIPQQYTCQGTRRLAAPLVVGRPRGNEGVRPHRGRSRRSGPGRTEAHLGPLGALRDPAGRVQPGRGGRPAKLPAGTREGTNDWNRTGYGGPCPPVGRHRYFHKLYALDVELDDLGAARKDEVEKAMEGHVLAKAELIGTYQKR